MNPYVFRLQRYNLTPIAHHSPLLHKPILILLSASSRLEQVLSSSIVLGTNPIRMVGHLNLGLVAAASAHDVEHRKDHCGEEGKPVIANYQPSIHFPVSQESLTKKVPQSRSHPPLPGRHAHHKVAADFGKRPDRQSLQTTGSSGRHQGRAQRIC